MSLVDCPKLTWSFGAYVLILAFLVAELLQSEVRNHLVRVHVGRCARPALDEVGDELVSHFAGDQPVARAGDGVGDPRIEHAQIAVRQRGGLLHIAEGLDEVRLRRHRNAGDVEVLFAAQRLHAVICGVGYLLLSKEVSFGPSSHVIAPPGVGDCPPTNDQPTAPPVGTKPQFHTLIVGAF
jgi:hypothetical protein